ncbi:MAG TPA: type II toxin-antitoxin system VapC family toxin [Gallionella sp.]|nr:type II toxin-antitoxin system VapC family toxin [Gallionella sp.]
MIYLLDTNVCIHLINERHPVILQRLKQHSPAEIAICSVVKAELLYGARRSQRVETNMQLLKTFFAPLQSLAFDDECAEHYGQIHAELLTQGKAIGPNDTLIASIARAHNATLVTHNTGEFQRVPGLSIADWELPLA